MSETNTSYLFSTIFNSLNSLSDIIYFADRENKIREIYGKWLTQNNYSSSIIIGKTIDEFFNCDSIDIHFDKLKQCLKNGEVNYEWTYKNSEKTSYFHSALTRVTNNGSYGVVGVIREITKLKEIELFYREIELSFKTLTNAANYGIISINENKAIEYSNPAMSVISGYSEQELHGNGIDIIFSNPANFYKFLESYIKEKFYNNKYSAPLNQPFEILLKRNNGKEISVEITLSSYQIFNVMHFVILIQDITLRKNAERELLISKEQLKIKNKNLEETLSSLKKIQDQLIHSEKMASLGALTAGIAHEINNPLAFVLSNINRFKEYFDDVNSLLDKWRLLGLNCNYSESKSKVKEVLEIEREIDLNFIKKDFLDLMNNNVNGIGRIKDIVQQLCGFSYSKNKNLSIENINSAIEKTLTLVWNEIKFKAEIIKNFGELPSVECNIAELKHVFVNLLINAAHSIEDKGQIIIDTFSLNGNVIIRISDNGSGIPPEIIDKIFDPFFTTKSMDKGKGLGLWVCMLIIKKHNGTLNVKSELGKGTIFEINLPLKQKRKEVIS